MNGQNVLWYVVSDCARLRGKAAELYGAKVMLPKGETPVEHLAFSSGNSTRDILAFRVAFAEQWLLGMTDFQVASQETSWCAPPVGLQGSRCWAAGGATGATGGQ